MAAIPSWAWLAIGLVISLTSWYVEMTLFFWLGLVFIVIGIMKLAAGFMLGEKETKQEKKTVHNLSPQHTHQYYRCACGNPVRVNDIFCSYCGRRLR